MNVLTTREKIVGLLRKKGDKEAKKNYERYFKYVIKMHGFKSDSFNTLFKECYEGFINKLSVKEQLKLAFLMFDSDFQEEKSFGVEILVRNVAYLSKKELPRLKKLIDKNVYDWATCDRLASRVIGRMIKKDASIAKELIPWKDHKNLWVQRAACVSFVPVARFGEFNNTIIKISSTVVKNPERFAQLGNGWMLRELSIANLDLVVNFIKKNYNYFSREGLRYAIEKMKQPLYKEMLNFSK